MKLTRYLRADSIIIGLQSRTKWEAIDRLLAVLDEQGVLADVDQVRKDLVEREQRMSTGMERGLAIPHAKSAGAKQLAIALAIQRKGLEFDSLDGQPAQVIFLVVSRKDTTGPHIQCLAEIASLYQHEEVRETLLAAKTAEDVMRLLMRE